MHSHIRIYIKMVYFRVFHQQHTSKNDNSAWQCNKPNVVTKTQAVTSAKQPQHCVLQQILNNTHSK